MNSRQQHAINIFVRIQNLATLLQAGLGAGEAQRLLHGETAPWQGWSAAVAHCLWVWC